MQVTIGEYLDETEKQLDAGLQKKINTITDQNRGSYATTTSRRKSFIANVKQEYESYNTSIKKLRASCQGQYGKPALIRNMQTTISDLYGDSNPFDNGMYPVYKIDKQVMDKCGSAQPQWIAIWFPFNENARGTQLHELCLTMTQHLNYAYIYNYFFDSEKIKNREYTPVNEQVLYERFSKYRGYKKATVHSK